jgi:hypothetical protein
MWNYNLPVNLFYCIFTHILHTFYKLCKSDDFSSASGKKIIRPMLLIASPGDGGYVYFSIFLIYAGWMHIYYISSALWSGTVVPWMKISPQWCHKKNLLHNLWSLSVVHFRPLMRYILIFIWLNQKVKTRLYNLFVFFKCIAGECEVFSSFFKTSSDIIDRHVPI